MIIAERQKPNWHLSAGVLPTVASAGTGLADDVRVPMSEAPFLAQNFTTGGGHTGHPHYTTLLGRPILMFAWFRGFESPSGTADRHRHEIWVQSLPADPFSPERLAPRASLAVVDANESGLWMPTYGRDATVFWDAGEAGDVNVDLAVQYGEGRGGEYHTESYSLGGAEEDYVTFASPPRWIRVRTANFSTPDIETWVVFH